MMLVVYELCDLIFTVEDLYSICVGHSLLDVK